MELPHGIAATGDRIPADVSIGAAASSAHHPSFPGWPVDVTVQRQVNPCGEDSPRFSQPRRGERSSIGATSGTPSIIWEMRVDAGDQHEEHRQENVGGIGIDVADMHPPGEVREPSDQQ
jgi:hypothetical protein